MVSRADQGTVQADMRDFTEDSLDRALWAFHDQVPERLRWLVKQTVYTAGTRRKAWSAWPFPQGARILDLGTGFGAGAIELAATFGADVTAVDQDPEVLQVARQLSGLWPDISRRVHFVREDIHRLSPGSSYDGAVARFLFQHLPDPEYTLRFVGTLLKPGGFLAVEDIDDGWQIDYPAAPPDWQKVVDAFRRLQQERGGDRYIGRKLGGYLMAAGYAVDRLELSPLAALSVLSVDQPGVRFEWERIVQDVPEFLRRGWISSDQWNRAADAWHRQFPRTVFSTNATIRIWARFMAGGTA